MARVEFAIESTDPNRLTVQSTRGTRSGRYCDHDRTASSPQLRGALRARMARPTPCRIGCHVPEGGGDIGYRAHFQRAVLNKPEQGTTPPPDRSGCVQGRHALKGLQALGVHRTPSEAMPRKRPHPPFQCSTLGEVVPSEWDAGSDCRHKLHIRIEGLLWLHSLCTSDSRIGGNICPFFWLDVRVLVHARSNGPILCGR